MVFHGVPFAEGLDDYDDVFASLGGFERSEAFDMGGVELEMQKGGGGARVRIDPSARIDRERVRGRSMCVMVRAYKIK